MNENEVVLGLKLFIFWNFLLTLNCDKCKQNFWKSLYHTELVLLKSKINLLNSNFQTSQNTKAKTYVSTTKIIPS